jgi:hypothetical protein
MNNNSKLIYTSLFRSITSYGTSHKTTSYTPLKNAKVLRDTYLKIIEQSSWIEQFTQIGQSLIDQTDRSLIKKTEIKEPSVQNIKLYVCGKSYDFIAGKKPVILVGRKPGCDILLETSMLPISRLHLMIFLLPSIDTIVVVDIGSYNGYSTKSRSDGEELPFSTISNRTIGFFSFNETVVIDISGVNLVINPKECVVCFENVREIVFTNCNHFSCCSRCSDKLVECPICKTPINNTCTNTNISIGKKFEFNCKTFC